MTAQIPNETMDQLASLPMKIMKAWGEADGDSFADVFAEDGTMVLPGGIYQKGREAIATFMRAAFQGPYQGTQVVGEPQDVRLYGDNHAILITVGGVRSKEATDVPADERVRATWVAVKIDDEWKLAAYQNSPGA